jgi:SSS family solute:Na+ symporter
VTGILATMPYIALQLVGIQAVLTVLGVGGDWPLIIAFVVLAGTPGSPGCGPRP